MRALAQKISDSSTGAPPKAVAEARTRLELLRRGTADAIETATDLCHCIRTSAKRERESEAALQELAEHEARMRRLREDAVCREIAGAAAHKLGAVLRDTAERVRIAAETFQAVAHLGSMVPAAALRRHETSGKEEAARMQAIRSSLHTLQAHAEGLREAWARWTLSSVAKVLRRV